MTYQDGFTLTELLIALALLLLLSAGVVVLTTTLVRAGVVLPASADRQQRLRAAAEQIGGWLAAAGQGLGGSGANAGTLLVPALYPHRRGVATDDPPDSFFRDRLTMIAGTDPFAFGSLAFSTASRASPLALEPSFCGQGLVACGFTAGTTALIADARASGEWFDVTRIDPGLVDHTPATRSDIYSVEDAVVMASIEVRALIHDPVRRQLRVLTRASHVPLADDVAAFEVRWYGDPRPPRGPRQVAGRENCILDNAGVPRLPPIEANHGPWVELTSEMLTDGPWCGAGTWRFDADLFRVRWAHVTIRLDAPGRAVLGSGQRSLPSIEFDVAPRNLGRQM